MKSAEACVLAAVVAAAVLACGAPAGGGRSAPASRPSPAGQAPITAANPAGPGLAEAHDADGPTVVLPGGQRISVEIADDGQSRQQGLMWRESIADGRGMLFVFETAGRQPFWMKNVNFPIDILWLDDNGVVVHVAADVPPCRSDPCPNYAPPNAAAPTRYVLELKAGKARRAGLVAGARLTLPALP